jgi:hypothetical protein
LRSYQTVEEEAEERIELAPGETSLDFLQCVYRSTRQPMSRRLRAAIEALPMEHPRLGAVAVGYLSGEDFAARLERAIERSGKAPKLIELKSDP